MVKDNKNVKRSGKSIRNIIILIIVLILFIGIPLLVLNYQSLKSGMSISQVFQRKTSRTSTSDTLVGQSSASLQGEKIDFLVPMQIGNKFTEPPLITNLCAVDLDKDGLLDVVVCDAKNNTVSWIRQYPKGVYTETVLASNLIAPAHVQVCDFNGDGNMDIMVAVLGMLFPNNDKIGSVVVLENDGNCHFKKHVIAENIARVSDVRAGDLNGDGLPDLAVAQFGYDDGETRWIENLGNWKFKSHILQSLSGVINVEICDLNQDGHQDIVSMVSQEWEEIYCFVNDGKGHFTPKLLWGSNNEDFGSSSLCMCDLNKDGKLDILFTNGDAFDYLPPRGRPWHGVQWLENKGNYKFEFHRICNFIGAYAVKPADVNKDGNIDLFAVSAFNLWDNLKAQSFIWMENLGHEKFKIHNIASAPTHLITLDAGDFNNDGNMDFVTGGMHAYPPFDRMGRVTLWMNNGKLTKEK